ncbi:hypothetical protein BpHYR1_002352, partial [Brachionus plicatilis]
MESVNAKNFSALSPSVRKTWNKLISFKSSVKKSHNDELNEQSKFASICRTNKIKTSTIKKTRQINKCSESKNVHNQHYVYCLSGEIDSIKQLKAAMISSLEQELCTLEQETMTRFSSSSSIKSHDSGISVNFST